MPQIPVILNLNGSVGNDGDNNPSDILAVKNRLADLGFPVSRDSVINSNTIAIIKLFQSIIKGEVRVLGDGRVDVNGSTHKFLQAANAPQWMEMPKGSPQVGFINYDNRQGDNHDFGTDWMVETIQSAAHIYLDSYLSSHPNAALIQTNNLSLPRGGDTPHHSTHETGLSCDIRVPRKDGQSGATISDSEYDREAMRAMLKAIRGQTKYGIKRIFFNDFTLVVEGLCQELVGHHNHAHIDIIAPRLGTGTAIVLTGVKQKILNLLDQEWRFWDQQTMGTDGTVINTGRKEDEPGFYERVGKYWQEALSMDNDGRDNVPWSSAFVSWIMKTAGAANNFLYSAAHSKYISQAISDRLNNSSTSYFFGYRLTEYKVKLGDIVCRARQDDIDYDNQNGGDYKSHGDIVVAIRTNEIDVIGGNVVNSVTKRTLTLDGNGFLTNNNSKYFVVIENKLP